MLIDLDVNKSVYLWTEACLLYNYCPKSRLSIMKRRILEPPIVIGHMCFMGDALALGCLTSIIVVEHLSQGLVRPTFILLAMD